MSESRNLAWLRSHVAQVLNTQPGDPDQAYVGPDEDPWSVIDDAINESYTDELAEAIDNTDEDLFRESETITWPISQRTLELPEWTDNVLRIVRIDDETNEVPGSMLWILSRAAYFEPTISWLDRRTLQWGTSGPEETKTLRLHYIPMANEMSLPTDTPRYIHYGFRRLLVWGAAVIVRTSVHENAPGSWIQRRDELRERYHQMLWKRNLRDTERPATVSSGPEFIEPV